MGAKRKDNKGRVLRNGECQRKDGRYQFEYVDVFGNKKCLYSWKLEDTDRLPSGKRKCNSLRSMEKEVQRCGDDVVMPFGGNMTVLELVKKYILQKQGVRETTRSNYNTVVSLLSKDKFGTRRIDTVKSSDARVWLTLLQQSGRSYNSIHNIRNTLRPAFRMAVEDEIIRKNPFDFELASVIINNSVTRDAITQKQKHKFLEFIRKDGCFKKYYDAIYILFYTGLRISEFCGLTINDIDFEKKTLSIERQLQRTSDMRYIIEKPKTRAGIRVLPLQDDVCECFRRITRNRGNHDPEPVVAERNGKQHSGFLFLDRNGLPKVAMHWQRYLQHICERYNKTNEEQTLKVTPHVCRHTYCSHCASLGMNPKHLQYLMGHSTIDITFNTYTHVDFDDIQREVGSLQKAQL